MSRKSRPHIRFWSPGLIAAGAKERIEYLQQQKRPQNAVAMVREWILD